MRAVNIQSLVSSKKLFDDGIISKDTFSRYLVYVFGSSNLPLRPHEWTALNALLVYLEQPLDAFYVGYSIPQVGKEFDLIRLAETPHKKYIINIELKSESNE